MSKVLEKSVEMITTKSFVNSRSVICWSSSMIAAVHGGTRRAERELVGNVIAPEKVSTNCSGQSISQPSATAPAPPISAGSQSAPLA